MASTINGLSLVRNIHEIGSPTLIYQRLLEVIHDPGRSATDFASILSEDPGMTARLLKIVNSAYYGFPGRIETISRAVTIVGTAQLCELVLATSVISAFKNIPQNLVDMDSFWRHSLACGLFCRFIAKARQEKNIERFFVAGLLHDIGRLIIYTQIPNEGLATLNYAKEHNMMLYQAEQTLLGINHAGIGGLLAEQWSLPDSLQHALRHHHLPGQSKCFPVEAATVHVADILSHAMDYGNSGEKYVPPLVPEAWITLALLPEEIPGLLQDVEDIFEEATELLLKNTEN